MTETLPKGNWILVDEMQPILPGWYFITHEANQKTAPKHYFYDGVTWFYNDEFKVSSLFGNSRLNNGQDRWLNVHLS